MLAGFPVSDFAFVPAVLAVASAARRGTGAARVEGNHRVEAVGEEAAEAENGAGAGKRIDDDEGDETSDLVAVVAAEGACAEAVADVGAEAASTAVVTSAAACACMAEVGVEIEVGVEAVVGGEAGRRMEEEKD